MEHSHEYTCSKNLSTVYQYLFQLDTGPRTDSSHKDVTPKYALQFIFVWRITK